MADHLWEALRQGFIVSLDGKYRYRAEAHHDVTGRVDGALDAAFRFSHDRVQQAAYSLFGPEERDAIHLRIGRLLRERGGADPGDRELFAIVDHLNRGARLIVEPAERRGLARLNLNAGRKARARAAPDAAVHYLRAALDVLGETGWIEEYEVVCAAHLTMAECEYLTGNLDSAFGLLQVVERNARSVVDRVMGAQPRGAPAHQHGQARRRVREGHRGAATLDLELPPLDDKTALGAAIGAEFGAYQSAIAESEIEVLETVSVMSDARELAVLHPGHQHSGSVPGRSRLHFLLVLKGVQLLRRGTAPLAGFFYAQYAIVHLAITGSREHAFRFGRLGLELATRGGVRPARVRFISSSGSSSPLAWHISHSLEVLRSGLRISLEMGDQIYASYCAAFILYYRMYAGESLHDLEDSLLTARDLADRTGDVVNQGICNVAQQAIRALTGQTRHPATLEARISRRAIYGLCAAADVGDLRGRQDDRPVSRWPLPRCPGHQRQLQAGTWLLLSRRARLLSGSDPGRADPHRGSGRARRTPGSPACRRCHARSLGAVLAGQLRAPRCAGAAEISRIERRIEGALDLADRAIASPRSTASCTPRPLATSWLADFTWTSAGAR